MEDQEILAYFRRCMKKMYGAIEELTEASILMADKLPFDFNDTWRAWDRWNNGPLRENLESGFIKLFEERPDLKVSEKEIEIENRMM